MSAPGGRWAAFAALSTWALSGASCVEREAPLAADPEFRVLFQGCSEVTKAGTCLVPSHGPTSIALWVSGEEVGPPSVRVDGLDDRAGAPAFVPVAGGHRIAVTIDRPPAVLRVERGGYAWRLVVAGFEPLEAVQRADALRKRGQFEAALEILSPLSRRVRPDVRLAARAIEARIALIGGRTEDAVRLLEENIRDQRTHGFVWGEMRDRYALSFIEINRGRYAEAQKLLGRVSEIAHGFPAGAVRAAYYRAHLENEVGDYRRALENLDRVMVHAERLGLDELWRSAGQAKLRTLAALGRHAQARGLLASLEARVPAHPSCGRAAFLTMHGGDRFVLRENRADLAKARTSLREAVELFRNTCSDPLRLAGTLAVLGRVELALGDAEAATEMLAQARRAHAHPRIPALVRQQRLEGEIAFATRDFARAAPAFGKLIRLGEALGRPDVRWFGLVGRAKALEALKKVEKALDDYMRAERVIDEIASLVPLGGGRELFLGNRIESAERLIDLLARSERYDEALEAARRSRARGIAGLQWSARLHAAPEEPRREWYRAVAAIRGFRRDRETDGRETDGVEEWRLSRMVAQKQRRARALRERAIGKLLDEAFAALGGGSPSRFWSRPLTIDEDELVALYHPVPEGWVLFAIERQRLTVERLGREATEAALIAPLSDALRRSRSVRFLVFGGLQDVDLHAAAFDGKPLGASRVVRYGLDVERIPRRVFRHRALVVDPYDDLPVSRGEADFAAGQLHRLGHGVVRLRGPQATPRAIQRALSSTVSIFHYAGHARYRGLDGWQSHLGTENQRLLSLGDILMLSPAPAEVILSGCETAETSSVAGAPGLGLAQAFVIAGSESVIAAVRPVKDTDADRLVRALYRARAQRPTASGAEILHEAQRALIESQSDVDWAAFRALVP